MTEQGYVRVKGNDGKTRDLMVAPLCEVLGVTESELRRDSAAELAEDDATAEAAPAAVKTTPKAKTKKRKPRAGKRESEDDDEDLDLMVFQAESPYDSGCEQFTMIVSLFDGKWRRGLDDSVVDKYADVAGKYAAHCFKKSLNELLDAHVERVKAAAGDGR